MPVETHQLATASRASKRPSVDDDAAGETLHENGHKAHLRGGGMEGEEDERSGAGAAAGGVAYGEGDDGDEGDGESKRGAGTRPPVAKSFMFFYRNCAHGEISMN